MDGADDAGFTVSRSPLWLLALALGAAVAGLMAWLFWGLAGAYVGYACTFAAFAVILWFRRRDTVLRQTSFVESSAGLRIVLPFTVGLTIAVMVLSVVRIATELSRGVG